MPLPIPRPGERWALFLDFDGTLTELVDGPGEVRVDPRLAATLGELEQAFGGAVALVSGRPLAELDRLLAPARLAAAGLHGLEQRFPDGRLVRREPPDGALEAIRTALKALAAGDPRLLLEDKGVAVALHYRRAPEREGECRALLERLLRPHPRYQLLAGKMVLEVKPRSADKGRAIEAFMAAAPFAGARPVFAGDDRTDEDGFAVVNARDGITVKVGDGASCARYRVDSVATLLGWLHALPGRLAATG